MYVGIRKKTTGIINHDKASEDVNSYAVEKAFGNEVDHIYYWQEIKARNIYLT